MHEGAPLPIVLAFYFYTPAQKDARRYGDIARATSVRCMDVAATLVENLGQWIGVRLTLGTPATGHAWGLRDHLVHGDPVGIAGTGASLSPDPHTCVSRRAAPSTITERRTHSMTPQRSTSIILNVVGGTGQIEAYSRSHSPTIMVSVTDGTATKRRSARVIPSTKSRESGSPRPSAP